MNWSLLLSGVVSWVEIDVLLSFQVFFSLFTTNICLKRDSHCTKCKGKFPARYILKRVTRLTIGYSKMFAHGKRKSESQTGYGREGNGTMGLGTKDWTIENTRSVANDSSIPKWCQNLQVD